MVVAFVLGILYVLTFLGGLMVGYWLSDPDYIGDWSSLDEDPDWNGG